MSSKNPVATEKVKCNKPEKIYRRIGIPHKDENGNLVYDDGSYRYYFEKGEDGHEYPVILVPSNFLAMYSARPVGFPSGYSVGNGCFVSAKGAS